MIRKSRFQIREETEHMGGVPEDGVESLEGRRKQDTESAARMYSAYEDDVRENQLG